MRWIGRWLMGVGLLHTAVALLLFHGPLLGIARDGFWNAVDGYPGRPLAFWFVYSGFWMLLLGAVVDWVELRLGATPRLLGWSLLGMGAAGCILMPVSGFWLALPPAVGILMRHSAAPPERNSGEAAIRPGE
jgi:hypothetical protein